MSKSGNQGMLFQAFKKFIVVIFRLIAFLFAWCCKLSGIVLEKIGEEILKIIE